MRSRRHLKYDLSFAWLLNRGHRQPRPLKIVSLASTRCQGGVEGKIPQGEHY